ncbi:hypothetical protein CPU12_10400 [Malaciobacter molluscorum LMG 25693]|uniref:Methyltransferase n=1 Tax=Malaciobacter molluscorum LMG 25693 TaxID=870501 RepID=A0A2G1DG39_9BACT|nr:class I SAM-dependent methyltransferase [Malaciobacter molluscorum]AXX91106.1 methyltransferase [Malaciobacter molluscorum LMG 25693]PHO17447.1 hypothetical protein CPU12_10400 [Malaciobacter molluscorum LMG 25693]RXJ93712.1 hypothetical protein CRV00_09620 [Malaciobacter molluscorum]
MQIDNHIFYKEALKEYGITARGVHWNSQFSQYVRFEVITKFINNIKESSIADAGCGFAEYLKFLHNKDQLPKDYIGIDRENYMLEISKERFPSYDFLQINIVKDEKLPKKDYYICSGAMNLLNQEDVYTFIFKCFSSSRKAFIFNYLKNETFVNVPKSNIINFCKKISRNIQIDEKYLNNDFTICLNK